MTSLDSLPQRPTKRAQALAREAFARLGEELPHLNAPQVDVAIEGERSTLTLPREALELLQDVLGAMAKGKPVSIVPMAMELTTQAAADRLGCSRPHLIKLLENGAISFTKVGRHRRIRFEDLVRYEETLRRQQYARIGEMMAEDETYGLYDEQDDQQ